MRGDGNFKWWWCGFEEMEVCNGPHDTREAAIASAAEEREADEFEDDETPHCWIVEADKMVIVADALFDEDDVDADSTFSGDRLIELITEANEEAWGEDGFEGLVGPGDEAAINELEAAVREAQLASGGQAACVNAVIADWLNRHQRQFRVFTFGVQRNFERVELELVA